MGVVYERGGLDGKGEGFGQEGGWFKSRKGRFGWGGLGLDGKGLDLDGGGGYLGKTQLRINMYTLWYYSSIKYDMHTLWYNDNSMKNVYAMVK